MVTDHVDYSLPLNCPWCDAPLTYSWWHGGMTCKSCGKTTGKAELYRGSTKLDHYKEMPGVFKIGDADGNGFVPVLHHSGWAFRCNVTAGSLVKFLKRCALLGNYIPMTVTSMNTEKSRTRWNWLVNVKIPAGARPFEMEGVEWHCEQTVRAQ
jgi:hypothetical protein